MGNALSIKSYFYSSHSDHAPLFFFFFSRFKDTSNTPTNTHKTIGN